MVQNSESEELYIVCKYGVRSGHYFIWLKVTFYMCSHLTLCKRIHEILPYFLHCTSDKSFQNVCLWASSAGWYKTLGSISTEQNCINFHPWKESKMRMRWLSQECQQHLAILYVVAQRPTATGSEKTDCSSSIPILLTLYEKKYTQRLVQRPLVQQIRQE